MPNEERQEALGVAAMWSGPEQSPEIYGYHLGAIGRY